LNGNFNVSFLEDVNGHSGEVVNVGESEIQTQIGHNGGFRTIEVPINLFGLLDGVELAEQVQTYDIGSDLVFRGD
jgi:hypothetical protein